MKTLLFFFTHRINSDEYAQLLGNFIEVVEAHEELLMAIESSNDRIGKLFLSKAAVMKCIHQAYCAAHPRAIVILDKYSEQLEAYMERQGAASPGLLVLTTGLSKPFRRLDKYAAMLQELERHMETSHPDRGDTQRSISIYKDIAVSVSNLYIFSIDFFLIVIICDCSQCAQRQDVKKSWNCKY